MYGPGGLKVYTAEVRTRDLTDISAVQIAQGEPDAGRFRLEV